MQSPQSPDVKKKKPALPNILSNIRNAQAVIGRAADDFHEREIRPLVGGGGGGGGGGGSSRTSASINQPQLHRVPSSSISSSLQNFSQRFGSQWRKRSSRRKKGQGVTVVPQSFYIAVGCFFVAFPLIFIVYVLARHAVFGDEGDYSGTATHIHEVPSAFSNGMAFESGKELLERNKIDPPVDGKGGEGEIGENPASEGLEVYSQVMEENDPPVLIESATNDLQPDGNPDQLDGTNDQKTYITSEENEKLRHSVIETKVDGSTIEDITKVMQEITGEGDRKGTAPEEIKPGEYLKGAEKVDPEQSAKVPSSEVKEGVVEEEANHRNLRGAKDGDK